MNKTAEFWRGSFGDSYTERNRVNWMERIPFWTEILSQVNIDNAVEFGCNAGWNLLAMRAVNPKVFTYGVEINETARNQAKNLGFIVDRISSYTANLTFTAGVLIHTHPDDLQEFMRKIISSSNKYVLAIEYASDKEVEISYRGHDGQLWKRPYGELYMDMGLKLIDTGEAFGFDNCDYWLLKK